MLPTIANCFDITVDKLIGMDEIRYSSDVKTVLDKAKENMSKGLIEDNIKLLAEAVKVHPNNYELLSQYAINLAFVAIDNKSEEYRQNNRKAAGIAERILAECTDPKIRNLMQSELCSYYQNSGESIKALETANKLPSIYKGCEIMKMNILKGEDLVRLTQYNVYHLTHIFCLCLQRLANFDEQNNTGFTWEERIEIYQKAVAIFGIVFDKGDYNVCFHNLTILHYNISHMAMRAGNRELALEALEKASGYAAEMDNLPDKKPYVSLLVNTLEYNSDNIGKNFSSTCAILLKNMSDSIYDEIRDNLRFKAVESSLQKFIKQKH